MTRILHLRVALWTPLLLFAAGCASSQATFSSWQRSVEQYVRDEGKGEAAVLRDVTLPDGRRGFSLLGGPVASKSADVHGVLLGLHPAAGTPRLVYLVGEVSGERVERVRLASVAFTNGRAQWIIGPENPAAMQNYRRYKEELWRRRFPNRDDAPPAYTGFPGEEDRFEMAAESDRIVAIHEQSGARWEMPLSSKQPARLSHAIPRRFPMNGPKVLWISSSS